VVVLLLLVVLLLCSTVMTTGDEASTARREEAADWFFYWAILSMVSVMFLYPGSSMTSRQLCCDISCEAIWLSAKSAVAWNQTLRKLVRPMVLVLVPLMMLWLG
jgi:hypothetical protein